MKLKARNVVSNWPRGRSQRTAWYMDFEYFLTMGRWSRWRWSVEDYKKLGQDARENTKYHQSQAEMLNRVKPWQWRRLGPDTNIALPGGWLALRGKASKYFIGEVR